MKQILTTGELARAGGVSRITIRRMERRGLLHARRDWRGWRVFSLQELQRLRRLLALDATEDSN
jgi:DNA-binding transcriptional MerR regulator